MVLLSYVGGKSRISKYICDRIPENVHCLVSPFFGAGSVEFLFARTRNNVSVKAYDNFRELVNFWKVVKERPSEFVNAIESAIPITKEKYSRVKKRLLLKKTRDQLRSAVDFFIVNKCSYNGIMMGSYSASIAAYFKHAPNRLRKFTFPSNIHIKQADFQRSIKAHPDKFLFVDPPYVDVKRTYGLAGELSTIDHEKLYRLLKKHAGHWILVYNDHPWVLDKYKKFKMTKFVSRYSGNGHGAQLLIQNF